MCFMHKTLGTCRKAVFLPVEASNQRTDVDPVFQPFIGVKRSLGQGDCDDDGDSHGGRIINHSREEK